MAYLLDRWQPLEDDFPELADQAPIPEDIF